MIIFSEYQIKNMVLKNRIVMPPMCMFIAGADGMPNDFHYTHYATRAVGGVGLIIVEATGVTPNGRISNHDLGIWSDAHIEGLKKIVDLCKPYGSKMAIQLNHAGRKCEADADYIVAPSPISFSETSRQPVELSKEEIREITLSFRDAARRADQAGFDCIEIHGAHGYLVNQFLSPLSNKRKDEYGGSVQNRARFLKEICREIRTVWPEEKPLLLRVSAHDYMEGGMDVKQMVQIINEVKDYIDMVHVSSGGVVNAPIHPYPGYQVPFAETIRKECGIPTIAVGLITKDEMVTEILSNNRADLVALGRELLRNPYWVLETARKYGENVNYDFPAPYRRAFQ